MHLARRVVRWEVQQLEVEFVRFNLARAIHLETHLRKDARHFAQGLRGGVQAAAHHRSARQGDIQPLRCQRARHFRRAQGFALVFKGRFQGALDLISPATDQRALFPAQASHLVKGLHQGRVAPDESHLPALQGVFVLDFLQLCQRLPFDLIQLLQHIAS